MAYNWADAHEHADTFELGINDELEDRIDELTRSSHALPAW